MDFHGYLNGNFRILKWRYLAYIRPIFQAYVRGYPHKIWPYMVPTYLHFRILKFPLRNVEALGGSRLCTPGTPDSLELASHKLVPQ